MLFWKSVIKPAYYFRKFELEKKTKNKKTHTQKKRNIVLYGWWMPPGSHSRLGSSVGTADLLYSALSKSAGPVLESRHCSLAPLPAAV